METKRIELSKDQIEAIEMHIAGKITMFGASQKQRELLTDVLEAAEDLMLEIKDMKPEDDLIEWYYGKYKEQQESSKKEA